jgi:hypothetical protein
VPPPYCENERIDGLVNAGEEVCEQVGVGEDDEELRGRGDGVDPFEVQARFGFPAVVRVGIVRGEVALGGDDLQGRGIDVGQPELVGERVD